MAEGPASIPVGELASFLMVSRDEERQSIHLANIKLKIHIVTKGNSKFLVASILP